jgi:translation initiation factor eIF-2B subunit epsilon
LHFCSHSGDNASDLELSDHGSDSSSEGESESSEDKDDNLLHLDSYPSSSATSLPTSTLNIQSQASVAETEFQNEVIQSLERAFTEGHSIDNAAVELKTLRMASNVPLSRVREAVVGAIVEQIRIVDGGALPQRNEIARVIDRWGGLINKIGGVDAVETIAVLQVQPFGSRRAPL